MAGRDTTFGMAIADDIAARHAKKEAARAAVQGRPRRWDGDGFSVKVAPGPKGGSAADDIAWARARRRAERAGR